MDGTVESGRTTVDESSLTGEPLPVLKQAGDDVSTVPMLWLPLSNPILLILLQDRIPVDGTVESGRTTVDESSLTGEPLPVLKQTGDDVTAGTMNYNGTLRVSARRGGGDTVLGDIVRMVEDAQTRWVKRLRNGFRSVKLWEPVGGENWYRVWKHGVWCGLSWLGIRLGWIGIE